MRGTDSLAGIVLRAPALVCEFSATTVVPPGWECRVDDWGNLVLKNAG